MGKQKIAKGKVVGQIINKKTGDKIYVRDSDDVERGDGFLIVKQGKYKERYDFKNYIYEDID